MEFEAPALRTDYDEVPYPGKFYSQSTPIRLATLATLHGLNPVPVDECRVLEMGCGDGGNLLPLACAFPRSQFAGVDLSSTAVASGRELARQLGLSNLHLCAQDLMDFSADTGQFDYIVAHGVFSWVPPKVRQQILKICARHLSPNGIAYISYNALPGGYLRRCARDLMLFHTRAIADPAARIKEGRNILDFAVSANSKGALESEILRREMVASQGLDSFLYHDILAEVNDPIYFLDFLDQAANHGLQFLAEALPSVAPAALPAHVRAQLDALPDRRVREQYLDFIYCRRFRQTLLCRTGNPVTAEFVPEAWNRLLISSSLQPTEPIADLAHDEQIEFRAANRHSVKVREAVAKAIFVALGRAYPQAIAYEELLAQAAALIGLRRDGLAQEETRIARLFASSYLNGVLELATYQPMCVRTVSDKPTAFPLARMQAAGEDNIVSAALQTRAVSDKLTRCLLARLDGTRTKRDLIDQLAADTTLPEPATESSISEALQQLADWGMLIA